MIEILPQSTAVCLVVHFSGKVTRAEYQQFLDALGEGLAAGNRLNLMAVFSGLEFYDDFSAFQKDLHFILGDYQHFHRAAFVGDQKWIAWFTRLISRFTKTQEKYFPDGEIKAAFQWASK
jgi:hypothetical protein